MRAKRWVEPSGSSVTPAGLEPLVIVIAGVLIALAADGWVQRQSERDLVRRYLADLATDLRADTAELSNVIALTQSRAGLGHAVLRAMDGVLST